MINVEKTLRYGKYGTKAQEIYDECCKNFGWEVSERKKLACKNNYMHIMQTVTTLVYGLFADSIEEKYN